MTFDWCDLVTVRAALCHRQISFTERAVCDQSEVFLDGPAIATLLELSHHHSDDAQSGLWADNAIAAVIASGLERDVLDAAEMVAESVLRLDEVVAAAVTGPVRFSKLPLY
jgi:hypothetical protein